MEGSRSASGVPEELYANLSVDDLVLYAAKRVLDTGDECTFERLVCECFTLFPKQFAFQRYPQWPDSARIDKSYRRCRTDKGWLVGSVKQGFRLSPKGERVAAAVEKKLSLGKPQKAIHSARARERYEAVVRYLRRSEAFHRYKANPDAFIISAGELRQLLAGTLETPLPLLRQNFHFYLDATEQYGDVEVLGFLRACRRAAEDLFQPQQEKKR